MVLLQLLYVRVTLKGFMFGQGWGFRVSRCGKMGLDCEQEVK